VTRWRSVILLHVYIDCMHVSISPFACSVWA